MPHKFASLLVHVAFSIKDRAPDLSSELSARLFPYMGGIAKELKATPMHHLPITFTPCYPFRRRFPLPT